MTQSVNQMPLQLSLPDTPTVENFFPIHNEAPLAALSQLFCDPCEHPFLYLWGKVGSGRSHLLQAACDQGLGEGRAVVYLPMKSRSFLDERSLENLSRAFLVCFDDVDAIMGDPSWEERLFHAYNRLQAAGTRVVFSAQCPPRQLKATLADLVSRLAACVVFQLMELSDTHKCEALVVRAQGRGLTLPLDVAEFLLKRCPRDNQVLFSVLEALDQASLAEQRHLTIPFVKQVLGL